MIDHLLVFQSETAAHVALDPLGFGGADPETAQNFWDGSRVIAGLKVYTPGTPDVVLPGFWVAIGLRTLSEVLRDLPGNACRIIADREAAVRGESFLRYVSPAVNPAELATVKVEPLFAGATYPFGG